MRRLSARSVKLSAAQHRDYIGASTARASLKAYRPGSSDPDSRFLLGRQELINRARDLERNVPVVAGAVDTKLTHVVGPGLKFQSRVDAKTLGIESEQAAEFSRLLEREFQSWANTDHCDIERSSNFAELQSIVLQSRMTAGDIFCVLPFVRAEGSPYGLKCQLIESERCSNNKRARDTSRLKAGVEKDENGAPTAYWFSKHHPGDALRQRAEDSWIRIPAFGELTGRRNVLHVFRKRRPGQTRGVPDLAPVIELARQLGSYTEAEISAAVNAAVYTIFVTSDDEYKENDPSMTEVLTDAAQITYLSGSGNEDVSSPTPGRPNAAFEAFVLSILSQMGSALGIPFEVMLKRFNSSFSASQAAMLEMYRYVIAERERLVSKFCNPVLEVFVDEAVSAGRLVFPGYLNGD